MGLSLCQVWWLYFQPFWFHHVDSHTEAHVTQPITIVTRPPSAWVIITITKWNWNWQVSTTNPRLLFVDSCCITCRISLHALVQLSGWPKMDITCITHNHSVVYMHWYNPQVNQRQVSPAALTCTTMNQLGIRNSKLETSQFSVSTLYDRNDKSTTLLPVPTLHNFVQQTMCNIQLSNWPSQSIPSSLCHGHQLCTHHKANYPLYQ